MSLTSPWSVPGRFDVYSWIFLSAFHLGWLAAPLIHLLLVFCSFSLFRGTPILAGGIGVARAVVGAVLWCLLSVFRAIVSL